jgi:hypothetical protein
VQLCPRQLAHRARDTSKPGTPSLAARESRRTPVCER